MTNAIQTGLLAYGMSGRLFQAPFVAAHPGFQLRAVTERHQKKAQHDYPEIISYTSVEELLQDPEIELIIVNTPSYTHFDFAMQALRAGKHVLVEKPLTASLAETQALYQLSREVGKQVFPYQNRRWDSDFLAVKQIIESGQLGRLFEVNFRYDRYKSTLNPKPFKEDPLPGSGLPYDLGPHLIDQVISLFGKPLKSHKAVGMYRAGTRIQDYFSIRLLYPDQLHVTVTSGLLVAQPVPAFVVHGTQGSFLKQRADVQEAQLDKALSPLAPSYGLEEAGMEGQLTLVGANDAKTTTAVPSGKGDYMHLFEAVYQAIRNNSPYPITEEHMLWQSALLEQKADE
ncbi:Gfo/Idh/MocA family oxidoreductase [Hymenobacter sp. BT491]|uniref:Gfo/Idh/MocA family oxidoreductase n=1 Tax=Hymenobacter sp. BT491 TaxID=2766779 RepID=UPI00165398C0|nr:Gfo/Idh/MocA family oxidoreductase [Hymenobacter sp. BT491]MBC6989231.1 Gfo/Idh/MocA family oxidoreductase [Hymenobacter sp. BT491]